MIYLIVRKITELLFSFVTIQHPSHNMYNQVFQFFPLMSIFTKRMKVVNCDQGHWLKFETWMNIVVLFSTFFFLLDISKRNLIENFTYISLKGSCITVYSDSWKQIIEIPLRSLRKVSLLFMAIFRCFFVLFVFFMRNIDQTSVFISVFKYFCFQLSTFIYARY